TEPRRNRAGRPFPHRNARRLFQGPGEETMIPKASQRGEGQDLATHLQNAFDNEYVEIADLRGAVKGLRAVGKTVHGIVLWDEEPPRV
ncbi:MAG TPA: hypothetical protein VIG47_07265, partial [Gemmatimonadaceae bacterium]